MKSTNANITKAIKSATGYEVKLHKGDGICHFYSDDEDTDLMLAGFDTTSIYVNTIGTYSVDEWVREFQYLLDKNADHIEAWRERVPYDASVPIILSYRKFSS